MAKSLTSAAKGKTKESLAKVESTKSSKTQFTITTDTDVITLDNAAIMIKMAEAVHFLETVEDVDGQLILSRKRAKHMRTWEKILKAENEDVIIEGMVRRKSKGGFVVDIDGIEAFLPSLMLSANENYTKGNVGKFRIVHTEPSRGTLVLGSSLLTKAEVKLNASMLNMREIISLHIGQA